ncbi:hypothetical protein [Alkaliphilus serpentinus]|uniref:Uncharacterized protein n=1 Tax=Alkaliphilus serpentinus TaxID=1482731 RepID=A0A833HLH1_9FIRM|nr:hypothetical protein [Alkaliphilus serpentinus]KAB3525894.1 hypothetical protein F8153_14260 [Alkaliphilus serpentinus]
MKPYGIFSRHRKGFNAKLDITKDLYYDLDVRVIVEFLYTLKCLSNIVVEVNMKKLLSVKGFKLKKEYSLEILKNVGVLLIICSVSWLIIYIMGHFITLHPNAYRDITKSILIVYGIFLIASGFYTIIVKKMSFKKGFQKFSVWWEDETPIEGICEAFTIVTVINSLMMIMGYDTPKEGVFAYIHMMTRLLIIAFIVSIWMWKDVLQWIKKAEIKSNFRDFFQKKPKNLYTWASQLFTFITAVYCILMILLYRAINPKGGVFFYWSLLGILAMVIIYLFLLRYKRKSI